MKTKTFAVLFALVMVLSMAVGVFAQDFSETWDENTVLTVFNDLDMYFPDMFADVDSDFIWVDNGPGDYPSEFANKSVAKAPIDYLYDIPEVEATYDPCGDGLIKYDMTITKMDHDTAFSEDLYYGEPNTTYVRDIEAYLTINPTSGSSSTFKLGLKTCESTGGDGCHSVTFKKNGEAHLKGYLTVPEAIIMAPYNDTEGPVNYTLQMGVYFSDYMTSLWDVNYYNEGGFAITEETVVTPTKKNYCQDSLDTYSGLGYETRAAYDENTGEARLQVVVRNFHPEVNRKNYVIPAEIVAQFFGADDDRITDYTCKYTVYNVANAAPRTDYCKFGEGIAVPDHGMVRLDFTIDHISTDILRLAAGDPIPFSLRLGGMAPSTFETVVDEYLELVDVPVAVTGEFKAVEFPCPKVSRMQVMDPLKPFMTFYKFLNGGSVIKPSGAYGVYEGGVWGMYQKCGKYAYMMVRLKNDGLDDEIVNLDHTAVAINGGTPMKWNWVMTTVAPEKGNKIVLGSGDEVILIGRAKVTDIPSQLNADTAMTGAVNFTDFGFYITGKVYSDHNNTRCVAAPK